MVELLESVAALGTGSLGSADSDGADRMSEDEEGKRRKRVKPEETVSKHDGQGKRRRSRIRGPKKTFV